ncbi:MAG TPA: sigma-70 family RNA polymerase sigma factor [Acidobacteriota bacterium]
MIERSDTRLVQESLQGSEEAWCALIKKYKNLIFSIPIKYGFSAEEAADLFQEVCLELLSKLPQLRKPQTLPKWLAQVTSHKCFHLKRRQQRFAITEAADQLEAMPAETSLAENILCEVEREQFLRDALLALSPRCRQLIQMLFFETPARPYQEIAKSLGLATGSIGFIRGRCLEQLRRRLEKTGFQ